MYRVSSILLLAFVTKGHVKEATDLINRFVDKLASRAFKSWSHHLLDLDDTTAAKTALQRSHLSAMISRSPFPNFHGSLFLVPGSLKRVPQALPEVQAPPSLQTPFPPSQGGGIAVPNLPSEEQLLALREFVNGVPDIPVRSEYKPRMLRNRYIGLRHGQSLSNVEGVISSDPELGVVGHGLTALGVDQARQSAKPLLELIGQEGLRDTVFISSDFLRARQTAEECIATMREILGSESNSIKVFQDGSGIDNSIRERFFGELDAKSLVEYNKVWPVDTKNADNSDFGVESINQVVARVGQLIRTLEEQEEGKTFVLVSHADTLQIIQTFLCWTVLQSVDPRMFSQYRFTNGEVRDMLVLPPPAPLIFDGINK